MFRVPGTWSDWLEKIALVDEERQKPLVGLTALMSDYREGMSHDIRRIDIPLGQVGDVRNIYQLAVVNGRSAEQYRSFMRCLVESIDETLKTGAVTTHGISGLYS